jgi:hypothetical protein
LFVCLFVCLFEDEEDGRWWHTCVVDSWQGKMCFDDIKMWWWWPGWLIRVFLVRKKNSSNSFGGNKKYLCLTDSRGKVDSLCPALFFVFCCCWCCCCCIFTCSMLLASFGGRMSMNNTLFKSLLNKKINGKSLVRILILFFFISSKSGRGRGAK